MSQINSKTKRKREAMLVGRRIFRPLALPFFFLRDPINSCNKENITGFYIEMKIVII